MYRSLMSSQDFEFIVDALSLLRNEIDISKNQFDFWICYGSFVLGQQTQKSDIDLLFVHHTLVNPYRIQAYYKEYPVTVYVISLSDLITDGNQRCYGGYFSGKLLNPFVVFGSMPMTKEIVSQIIGGFIGDFAAAIAKKHGREIGTRENLSADCFLSYLWLCPAYDAYFLRYYMSPNFKEIWDRMGTVISDALLESNIVTKIAQNRFEYHNLLSSQELHVELINSVARFWSFGACCHGCNFSFSDYYFQKAKRYIIDNELEDKRLSMLSFLEKSAN